MNAPSLLSPHWYRVAYLKPRLKSGVRVSRQSVRGQTWFVLTDPVSGRHHRFNSHAWGLIAACDGALTIDDVWAQRVDALSSLQDALVDGRPAGLTQKEFQLVHLLATRAGKAVSRDFLVPLAA